MTLPSAFCKILVNSAVRFPDTHGSIVLKEVQNGSVVMTLEVSDLPAGSSTVKLDGNVSHFEIVQNDGRRKRQCDYLLVVEHDNHSFVIFIELKRSLYLHWARGKEQVCRSLPFFEYLRSLCEIDCQRPFCRAGAVSYHYWVIASRYGRSIDKQRIRMPPHFLSVADFHHGVEVKGMVSPLVSLSQLTSP